MFVQKDHLNFQSVNTEKQRSYYIPFAEDDEILYRDKIVDRRSSSRFISLDGEWGIREFIGVENADINADATRKISVPSCVQMHGFDHIQYLNERYPFFYEPPYIDEETPVYVYRKSVRIEDLSFKYYLNFDGVDSGFYLFVNKKKVGYGNIAHSGNEFDVTPFLTKGENVFDVVVLKWTAGSYLECQDKFRFTGIFRNVYLLKRPKEHIVDYKINTDLQGGDGIIEFCNESRIEIAYSVCGQNGVVGAGKTARIVLKNATAWTAENPYLYDLVLRAKGEKIIEKIGIRTISIEDGIFKINGTHVKLKGVNRHESNPKTGATVTVEDTVKDLELMKWANVNAIRTAHYPDMPEFYQLTDAYGFYLIDEADVETHGAFNVEASLGFDVIIEEANRPVLEPGVYVREVALVERDKNRASVVMWSLGNECAYGSIFYRGADYIRARDSRPIHYQAIAALKGKSEEYYTNRIDVLGCFYPEIAELDEYLADKREKRPLVLSEYLHAMGNSCGGLKEYWEKLYSNDRFIGAFAWEWCDHAIEGEKGFLYGGDSGEIEHDSNFCVDGLVTPDRKIKSNLQELRAAYAKQGVFEEKEILCAPLCEQKRDCPIAFVTDKDGRLSSFGRVRLKSPLQLNITRAFIDNDVRIKPLWEKLERAKMQTYRVEKENGKTVFYSRITANCLKPILRYTLTYHPFNRGLDVTLEYEVADFVRYLGRVGFEFSLNRKDICFSYKGYGPTESYCDKHLSSTYGEYRSTAWRNFRNYIMPQENGSHYQTTRLDLAETVEIVADRPFSFSVLPYSTKQLQNAGHNFELHDSDGVYVNLDLTMSGVGTCSCGPDLPEKYQAAKKGKNTFRFLEK